MYKGRLVELFLSVDLYDGLSPQLSSSFAVESSDVSTGISRIDFTAQEHVLLASLMFETGQLRSWEWLILIYGLRHVISMCLSILLTQQ